MKIVIILLAGLILTSCDLSHSPRYLDIRHGEILLDNLAQECKGELHIFYKLSGDSELIVTCTQLGPIENSLLSISEEEK